MNTNNDELNQFKADWPEFYWYEQEYQHTWHYEYPAILALVLAISTAAMYFI